MTIQNEKEHQMSKVTDTLSSMIKAEARRLGFSAVGMSKAAPVDSDTAEAYRQWIENGKHADMDYLRNNLDKRLNPLLLMPEAKTIISLAMNYYPERRLSDDQYQFAYYAYGKDYHDVIKDKLRLLITTITERINEESETDTPPQFKMCVDTVPMLDRYWATKAGLGWIGKNTNLIIPHSGSFFFLAEIITDLEMDYDSPIESRCGKCERCVTACPGKALTPYCLDANKCLSYLTIENRGPINIDGDEEIMPTDDIHYIYGCDRCQLACPYNRFAEPTTITEFFPSDEFLDMRDDDWDCLTQEQYRTIFKGSAVKRAKYDGLRRNIEFITKRKKGKD